MSRRAHVPVIAAAVAAVGAIGATATGGIIVALLADGFGLAATGTLVLAAAQLGAVLAVTVIAALGGLVCWALAWIVVTVSQRASADR